MLDQNTKDQLRWQYSPLVRCIEDVTRASLAHTRSGARVGNNKATGRVVGAADELRLLIEAIKRGELDGLGYAPETGS